MVDSFAYSKYFLLDRVTGAQQVITTDHSKLHEGLGFSVITKNASLANTASLTISILPAAGVYIHLKRYEPWFNGDYSTFSLLEGCTISGGASAGTNRNRVSAVGPKSTILTGGTITGGTELESSYVTGGSGIAGTSMAGSRNMDLEFVLKPSIQYALKLTNNSGDSKAAALWCFFYEEEAG